MGLVRFNYRSEELGRYVDISIALPTDFYSYKEIDPGRFGGSAKGKYEPGMKFQTVYLIHGGGDDDSLTYRYTNAERFAQRNNVILVTPDISNSFGVDTEYSVRYQSFIALELPKVVQTFFASSEKPEDNFIAGYAMGGNVALGTAILHPEQYRMCVDFSGGIGMTLSTETLKSELGSEHFVKNFNLYNTTFGDPDKLEGSRFDLYSAAKRNLEEGKKLPDFIICCGDKEFIRERVERDAAIMKDLGYPVKYVLAEGYDHNFDMWEHYLQVMLDEWLPLKRFS